ncbi:MAG: hypothetical protein NZ902_04500 [Acidilobaceae archaeon]|nr:hypothetical protein [Acidilobaceae archaeon]MCX8165009.1 hypothetical protein [Acidilobaceae archaeon]MDW7974474.1 hypothetical protein [Sulfolobales archaeon]
MTTWSRTPDVNLVLEAIKRLSEENKGSDVEESAVLHRLEREDKKLSPADLSKILITLEALGYIRVQLSTKEEKIIRLLSK